MEKAQISKIFESDDRIAYITEYMDGWVPNSYKWKCTGEAIIWGRSGQKQDSTYDRKRSNGNGPKWVAMSAKHGRLQSA
jgi:hypothetical protein